MESSARQRPSALHHNARSGRGWVRACCRRPRSRGDRHDLGERRVGEGDRGEVGGHEGRASVETNTLLRATPDPTMTMRVRPSCTPRARWLRARRRRGRPTTIRSVRAATIVDLTPATICQRRPRRGHGARARSTGRRPRRRVVARPRPSTSRRRGSSARVAWWSPRWSRHRVCWRSDGDGTGAESGHVVQAVAAGRRRSVRVARGASASRISTSVPCWDRGGVVAGSTAVESATRRTAWG